MDTMPGFCKKCDKKVKLVRPQPKVTHLLHFTLSIITSGLWVFIWLITVMYSHLKEYSVKYRCNECGSNNIKHISPSNNIKQQHPVKHRKRARG